uniref:Uncharacterized protein n=1 Tax=Physcomitrium patens TaxID=3218 RepID=A0A7I3Z573_PHYPA
MFHGQRLPPGLDLIDGGRKARTARVRELRNWSHSSRFVTALHIQFQLLLVLLILEVKWFPGDRSWSLRRSPTILSQTTKPWSTLGQFHLRRRLTMVTQKPITCGIFYTHRPLNNFDTVLGMWDYSCKSLFGTVSGFGDPHWLLALPKRYFEGEYSRPSKNEQGRSRVLILLLCSSLCFLVPETAMTVTAHASRQGFRVWGSEEHGLAMLLLTLG